MRIHPFVLYTYLLDTNIKTKIEIIELASALTHAHPRSKLACGIYAFVLWELLEDKRKFGNKETIRRGLRKAKKNIMEICGTKVMKKNTDKKIPKCYNEVQ